MAAAVFISSMPKANPCTTPISCRRKKSRTLADADVPGAGAVHERHAGDVAQGSDAECDDHGEQADQDDGDQLGDGDAGPARFQGEGDQAGALAPFGGDREDAEHREQHALRGGRRADEVDEGELVGVGDEQEDDDDGDGDDADRGEQPEPGPGVDELAQLDPKQAAERDGRHARVRWWLPKWNGAWWIAVLMR